MAGVHLPPIDGGADMYTDICKLIGIKYPIFQGAMTFVTDKTLVAAVSNAGGLGIFAPGDDSAKGDAEWLRSEIQAIRQLTDKPFGVNLAMRSSKIESFVNVICEEKVRIITSGGGDPSKYIQKLKEADVLVCPVVPDAKTALKMEAMGADMVVCSGMEGGGFVGTVSTIVSLPQVTAAVKIPVIAAGGIYDGRGMAAAMAMGASGVQLGTRFMLSTDCVIPENVKEAMLNAKSKEAVAVDAAFRRGPHLRCLKTQAVIDLQKYENGKDAEADIYMKKFGLGRQIELLQEGKVDEALLPMGESAGAIDSLMSAQEIIDQMMRQYAETVTQMPIL